MARPPATAPQRGSERHARRWVNYYTARMEQWRSARKLFSPGPPFVGGGEHSILVWSGQAGLAASELGGQELTAHTNQQRSERKLFSPGPPFVGGGEYSILVWSGQAGLAAGELGGQGLQ